MTVYVDGTVRITSRSKHAKGRELSQYYTHDGYLRVKMNNKHYLIHHLVAQHCIGNRPKNKVINHKDCNKENNHPDNLEYVSINDNIQHSIKNGMHVAADPTRHGNYKDGRAVQDRKKEYQHEWYMKNKSRLNTKSLLYYTTNKETILAQQKRIRDEKRN